MTKSEVNMVTLGTALKFVVLAKVRYWNFFISFGRYQSFPY